MEEHPKLLAAEELDRMSPDERSAAFEQRIVADLDAVPSSFKDRIVSTAERLGSERRAAADE